MNTELHPLTLAIKLKNKAKKVGAHPRFVAMLEIRVQHEAYKERIEHEKQGAK